jgi:dipeptidyl aminopeptidase/acylaminoacyl peptidase
MGSAAMLLGPQPSPESVARRSPALHVSAATPPLFLTHAVDDRTVPMQNSILMLEAMKAAKRPVEAHFFPQGGHGFGLGKPGALCAQWPDLFVKWLDQSFAAG